MLCLYFFCRVLAQRGEVVFKRAQACCSTAAIEPDPPLSRKRLSSTPQVLVLEAGLTALTPCKRPAVQANRPVCARAGLRVRGWNLFFIALATGIGAHFVIWGVAWA